MRLPEARIFYDLITKNHLSRCLELGFLHGVASAYIAGALQDVEGGHLTTIDLERSRARVPNIHSLLEQTGLGDLVDIYFEPKTCNWRLMRLLQAGKQNSFDFAYLDGAHTWTDAGFAFLLLARLLAPGGWVAFDGLYFTFDDSNNRDKEWFKRLPKEEQIEPQVLRVFELLVQEDATFTNFRRIRHRFAFAQKVLPQAQGGSPVLPRDVSIGVSYMLERAHDEPDYRQQLMVDAQPALEEIFGTETSGMPQIIFQEANSFAPMSTWKRDDGVFVVQVEYPSWAARLRRVDLQQMLLRP